MVWEAGLFESSDEPLAIVPGESGSPVCSNDGSRYFHLSLFPRPHAYLPMLPAIVWGGAGCQRNDRPGTGETGPVV